jgi:hypothetical protein
MLGGHTFRAATRLCPWQGRASLEEQTAGPEKAGRFAFYGPVDRSHPSPERLVSRPERATPIRTLLPPYGFARCAYAGFLFSEPLV